METELLAKMAAELAYEDLDTKTVDSAKQCFLDWLANCMCGGEMPAVRLMRQVLEADESKEGTAMVFAAAPYYTSARQAALLNGMASHSQDFDDLHNASLIHLGTVVIPAALAVAQRGQSSGKDLIAAIVAGYEIGARIGECINPSSYYFWHTTGTAGTFAAAAGAGNLLQLTARQMIACLGTAGTQAAGLWEFLVDGAMSKALHAGKAAYNGILAADLSELGFTAAKHILEGDKGFCRAMDKSCDLRKLTKNLGADFKIVENSFKPYACCKHCHPAIYALLLLIEQNEIAPANVSSVVVKTNQVAASIVDNIAPQTAYGHKFSLQYCLAAAVQYGRVGLDEFTEKIISNMQLRRFMGKVSIVVEPLFNLAYERNPDQWPVEVTLATSDGKTYCQYSAQPKGDPKNPMTYAETEAKFRHMMKQTPHRQHIEQILEIAKNLEQVKNMAKAFPFLHKA